MANDLVLQCSCGKISGLVTGASPSTLNRVVCYCDDCQAFARHVGHADRVLDANGGTDICQTSFTRVRFTEGVEHVGCVRLKPKGLLRWHATCCATPIGNTMAAPALPFVGLVHACLRDASDGTPRNDVTGPVRGYVNTKFATGDTTELKTRKHNVPFVILRMLGMIAGARLRGDHKRSPFFQPGTKTPIATPATLTDDERSRAYRH